MKILITGGAGFIGSRLAQKCVERGDDVIVLDNLSTQVHGEGAEFSEELQKICECIRGDVRDAGVVRDLVGRVDGIMHMVAETGMGQSMYQMERYSDVNTRATGILLDCVAKQGKGNIRKLFIPSTSRVYGEGRYLCRAHGEHFPGTRKRSDLERGLWGHYCPVCGSAMEPAKNGERDKLTPTSVYAITKLAQEQMLLLFGSAHGVPAFSLRYQNVYGPGQSLLNPYTGVLNVFAQQISNGQTPEIYEMGLPKRDFVHVDDVVECTIMAFFADNVDGMVLNVGGGEPAPIAKVAEIMMRQMGMEGAPILTKKYRMGDVLFGCADMELTKAMLGWGPRKSIEKGIGTFVAWLAGKERIQNRSGLVEEELKATGLLGGN